MRYLVLLACLLCSAGSAQAQTVTLAWNANTEPDLAGYVVQASPTRGGPYSDVGSVSNAFTQETIPVEPGQFYAFVVRAFNRDGRMSSPSTEVTFTAPGQVDDCAPITGKFAVSVFPTSLLKTGSKGPGSKTRFDFQVASSAPVTNVTINANNGPLSVMAGADLTALAGMWFTMPPSGTYTLSITAKNAQNCSTTVTYRPDLVVP